MLINLYIEKWENGFPIPNGEDIIPDIDYTHFGTFINSIRKSGIESNFNEIFYHASHKTNGVIECLNYKDMEVICTDKLLPNAKNFYTIFSNRHFEDLHPYFDIFDVKLKEGLDILFINFHEAGTYTRFYNWVNNNPNKHKIYTISPAYNLDEFVNCNNIFFPYHLYDFDRNFKIDGNYPVCTINEYINTPKEKTFLSFNKNVKRFHRLYFYEFCKDLNLINSNYVSFLEFQNKPVVETQRIMDIHTNLKKYKENYINSEHTEIALDISSKMTQYEYDENCHNWNNNKDYYAKSMFSIVTETMYFEPEIMLTEKIVRPLANCHPFILIGPKYGYKILKEIGFEIPNLINYEYLDSISNPYSRLDATIDELKKLFNNLDNKNKSNIFNIEMLMHNQNKLLNTKKEDVFYELYVKLYNK
jgi:hypothetical protein